MWFLDDPTSTCYKYLLKGSKIGNLFEKNVIIAKLSLNDRLTSLFIYPALLLVIVGFGFILKLFLLISCGQIKM